MNYITESGIPDLGKIPWGTHFCQLYSSKEELAQSLIPYFIAGLTNNEQCIWVTSEPYNVDDAAADFKQSFPGFRAAVNESRLKILDYSEWYTSAGLLDGRITEHWLDLERHALSEGFEGLRISGNTSFVPAPVWDAFMRYERAIHETLKDRRILVLCSYNITKIEPTNIFEMIRAHEFTIHRNNGFWEMLEAGG